MHLRSDVSRAGVNQTTKRRGAFPDTHWTLVMRAREHGLGEPEAAHAMGELCQAYWKPVYAFLRRRGAAPHDAEDLTQGFFAMLLERDTLAEVDQSKGRLRSFLLVAVTRFAANEHERAVALKRGGGVAHVYLDAGEAEQALAAESLSAAVPCSLPTPELLFDRQWALSLLDRVLQRMRGEYTADARSAVFEVLKDRISADGDAATLAQSAAGLGMSEGALKVAVWRMRQRYRQLLHEEIARTVDSPEEVKEEILHLFKVLG